MIGRPWRVKASLQQKTDEIILLDTGAGTSVISHKMVNKLNLQPKRLKTPIVLRGLADAQSVCDQSVRFSITIEKQKHWIQAVVTDDIPYPVIIGFNDLRQMNVPWDLEINNEEDLEYIDGCWIVPIQDIVKQLDLGNQNLMNSQELADNLANDGREDETNQEAEEWKDIRELIKKEYADVINKNLLPMKELQKQVDRPKFKIDFKDENWSLHSAYYSSEHEEALKREVDKLLDNGIIRKSTSNVVSPAFVIPKGSTGEYRMVIDYRKVNKNTIIKPFPIPKINDIFNKMKGAKYFSTLDLHSGYHQLLVEEKDIFKTAFTVPFGNYEFLAVPFGMVNAPYDFSSYIGSLFRNEDRIENYLDDIIIFSETIEQHTADVKRALEILRKEKLIAKDTKTKLFCNKTSFLGFGVGGGELFPLHDKVKSIREFPTPTKIKHCQSFLGMANFYRRFIDKFSQKVRPMIDFITEKSKWGKPQQESFNAIKEALMKKPVLKRFEDSDNLVLTVDASNKGISGVLEAVDEKGKTKGVIEYFSAALHGSENNYYSGDLELLALVTSIKHFKYYLTTRKFLVKTDHSPLLALKANGRLTSRLERWMSFLSEFNFDIEYIKGSSNIVADALSRNFNAEEEEKAFNEIMTIVNGNSLEDGRVTREQMLEASKNDELYLAIKLCQSFPENKLYSKGMKDKARREMESRVQDVKTFDKMVKRYVKSELWRKELSEKDGLLLFRNRIIVPKSLQPQILRLYHDHLIFGGHLGVAKTYKKINDRYYWPGLTDEVHKYVKSCLNCQLAKKENKTRGTLKPLEVSRRAWGSISMDFVSGMHVTEHGHDRVLVVIDRLTKYALFIPCTKTLNSATLLMILARYVFSVFGMPYEIVSDGDILFNSDDYEKTLKSWGITLSKTTVDHPQADGQSERTVQILNTMIRTHSSLSNNWDEFLPFLQLNYNHSEQRIIKMTPYEALFGRRPPPHNVEFLNELDVHTSTKARSDTVRLIERLVKDTLLENNIDMQVKDTNVDLDLKKGEWVLLNRDGYYNKGSYTKALPVFLGPFKVLKVLKERNNVQLGVPTIDYQNPLSRIFNVKHIKKYVERKHADGRPLYTQRFPTTEPELRFKFKNISMIKAWDKEYLYCAIDGYDPILTAPFPIDWFRHVPDVLLEKLKAFFEDLQRKNVVGEIKDGFYSKLKEAHVMENTPPTLEETLYT